MFKKFDFGKVDYYGIGRKINRVTVEVETTEGDKPRFTASGGFWNGSGIGYVRCGQCLDEINKFVKDKTFKKIYRLWKLYHLNDLNAGTPEQTEEIEKLKATGWKYTYEGACSHLKEKGLYEVMLDGAPYKYGHAWLYRAIPEGDLQEIRELLEQNNRGIK